MPRDRRYGTPEARAAADAARNRRLKDSGGMQVSIRLDPERAAKLREKARAEGKKPTALASEIITNALDSPA